MNLPTTETILNEFLNAFSVENSPPLVPENASIERMTSSAFKVSTEVSDWLVKLTNKRGDQLEKENGLLSALHAKEASLFSPYCRTKSGASYLSLPGDHGQALNLVAMPFLENSPTFKWTTPTWTPSHSAAAGRSLRKFHERSKDCLDDGSIAAETFERVPIERMRSSLLDKIDHARRADANHFSNSLPPIESLRALIISQQFNAIENLPSPVVLHGDFHPGNVLFNGTAVKSIIDLEGEFCFRGNTVFDLSYALIAFSAHWQSGQFARNTSVNDYLRTDHFRSLLAGYRNFESPENTVDTTLKQALCYSSMLFLLWAFDTNSANPELSCRVSVNAAGLLTALSKEHS